MFQRILVPVDGSLLAERAILIAARLARASGGSLILLRVAPVPFNYSLYIAPSPNYIEDVLDTELAAAKRYLEEVARSNVLIGVKVATSVLFGTPAQTILAAIESDKPDLVVMCSHGHTGFKRWVLGSVAQELVRSSPIPVLVLRAGGTLPISPSPDAHPMRALVALDGSALAQAALLPAAYLVAALAAPGQGSLHLTRVVKPPLPEEKKGKPEFMGHMGEQAFSKAKTYLSSMTEHLHTGPVGDLKLAITWSVAFDTDAADGLIRVAENGEDAEGAGVFGGCDIIALATHGRSGVQRWAMGSVTERVLGATRLPLLVVRPQVTEDRHESDGEEFAEAGRGGIHMGSNMF
jgi:nucleotide-binding universal stress UspA family protein